MSIRRFFHRRQWDRERSRELESHLMHEIDDNLACGMTPQEARRRANIKLGNPTLVREQIWRMNSFVSIENLGRDLRYALRQLHRSPGFAAAATFTLALGIGVNTAIFSIVNGLLFSSLHIRQENRVVTLGFQQKGTPWRSSFSLSEYHDLRTQADSAFSDLIGEQSGLDGLSVQGNKSDRVFTDYVSGNYFQALGVQPLLGRFFRPSEGEIPGADPVTVLSYSYWKRHFASDPHIIGRQVALDGHPITVIGVAPRNYRGTTPLLSVQAYLPLAMIVPIENTPFSEWSKRDNRNMTVSARLQPGITQQQANIVLAVLARRVAAEHPVEEKDMAVQSFPLYLGRTGNLDTVNSIGLIAAFFFGIAGLVLLLACVNVTSLLIVRATVHEREMVIRSALGAQRSRLVRQMLTESILLSLFGGTLGIGLGLWGSSLLGSVNLQTDFPLLLDFGIDWHVLFFSIALALVAGMAIGLIPAIRLGRANLNLLLRESSRGVIGGGGRFRDALVVLQVGGALMLLVIAGLFTRSLAQLEHLDLGFNPSHVLTLSMDPSEIGLDAAQSRDFYRNLLTRVRSLPGVDSASFGQSIPMGVINNQSETISVSGYQPPPGQSLPTIGYSVVGTDYLQTLQVPLIEGRDFTESDDENKPRVAMISHAMAKKFWPTQNPVGKLFTMNSDPTHPLQIVGVARDARYESVMGSIDPYFYVPFLQHYKDNSLESLEIRTPGDPASMVPEIARVIHNMAPALPIFEVKTLQQALYSPNGLLLYQVAATLAGIMGSLGLILAVIGVYGVLAYIVSQKTNEIGIRMALGARRLDVLKTIYRHGLWIVGIGLTLGVVASVFVARLLHSMIVVSPTDPTTYVGVSAILIVVALSACYIPARRAMHIEPMQALRAE